MLFFTLGGFAFQGWRWQMPAVRAQRLHAHEYDVTTWSARTWLSHQAQCITIRVPFTIYDWNRRMMQGRGQYVAVTRGTCMEHVQIARE